MALHMTSLRDPKLDCVHLLAELGAEQHFEITYVDIEERTVVGDIQCLVQISTMPVAVCHGAGHDQTSANNSAARNCLEYLKIMVKKSTNTQGAAVSPKNTQSAQQQDKPPAKTSTAPNPGAAKNGTKKSK